MVWAESTRADTRRHKIAILRVHCDAPACEGSSKKIDVEIEKDTEKVDWKLLYRGVAYGAPLDHEGSRGPARALRSQVTFNRR